MSVIVTGAEGVLRWGYRRAALLRAWTITKDEQGVWAITGTLADVDYVAVSQRPLTFQAPNGWRWPLTTLQMTDASLYAVLGPKESTRGAASSTA